MNEYKYESQIKYIVFNFNVSYTLKNKIFKGTKTTSIFTVFIATTTTTFTVFIKHI